MSKDMLGSVVRAAVAVPQDNLDVLAKVASKLASGVVTSVAWRDHLEKLLDEGLPSDVKAVRKLLERLSAVALPAVAQFVATEKFRPGKTTDGIKVGRLGASFKEHLLPKVESDEVAAEELAVNKLLKGSRDSAIITALGGEEKIEINLGQFWEFLKTADQNFWYVAYIRDTEGVLWAVGAHWFGGGLLVEASSLDDPFGWFADRRFLSR